MVPPAVLAALPPKHHQGAKPALLFIGSGARALWLQPACQPPGAGVGMVVLDSLEPHRQEGAEAAP